MPNEGIATNEASRRPRIEQELEMIDCGIKEIGQTISKLERRFDSCLGEAKTEPGSVMEGSPSPPTKLSGRLHAFHMELRGCNSRLRELIQRCELPDRNDRIVQTQPL